ncbi:MAG: Hsp20/alpha crystallin family protein [Lachnospiraceae bacterium]|nr:Hsp20/alpha crystallin family protein [Lachnospiraceae bacterium]
MLMPSIFGETLLDDFFGFPKERYVKTNNTGLMQTDISESDNSFSLIMNLPGFKKEDVKAELKDGYLTVNASTNTSNEEKDDNGKYIRRERYSGSCSRSFYIGEAVTQEDIKAKFEDGTLKITVPKKELKPEIEEAKYIAIEG